MWSDLTQPRAAGRLLALLALLAAWTPAARSQDPEAKTATTPTLEQLAERVRVLEEANRRLTEERERKGQQNSTDRNGQQNSTDRREDSGQRETSGPVSDSPLPDYGDGLFSPSSVPRFESPDIPSPTKGIELKTSFGPGFGLRSADDLYTLQIHYESQIDFREWDPGEHVPANNGFFLPRQRFFFNGNITQPVEYEVSFNRGLNGINLLNAYLNFHFDDRFEVRVGRYLTPFTYDQYAVSNYWLLTPERSVFTTNLSPNRQIGAMAWGYLCDKRLDYAAGVFNGSRNSFESHDNNLNFIGYLNARPFQDSSWLPFARFLNVGASVDYGRQDQEPVPVSFRIAGNSPDASVPGNATMPFLILNSAVREQGDRLLGSAHAAYFYKGLSLIGEWQYGYGTYINTDRGLPARVPFSGFYVSAGYFLTGEEVERRTRVKPLRPVFPSSKQETRGIGAWEIAGRVARLQLGEEVFAAGLADRAEWSNSAVTTEIGVNWYLNEYLKVAMFWLHGEFGSPVVFRPGDASRSADLLWLRCQLYF